MTTAIECPWCKGTGKNLYNPGPCPACMGVGSKPARTERELREAGRELEHRSKQEKDSSINK